MPRAIPASGQDQHSGYWGHTLGETREQFCHILRRRAGVLVRIAPIAPACSNMFNQGER